MQQDLTGGAPGAPSARRIDALIVVGLRGFNGVLHIMLGIALVAASLMVIWEFVIEVGSAIQGSHFGLGFLHAMGTLFLLWTLSALISAEIGYIRTGRFQLRVFIEVAMITLLRQLIIRPMQQAAGDTSTDWAGMAQFGLVLLGLLAIGILHRLAGQAEAAAPPADVIPGPPPASPAA